MDIIALALTTLVTLIGGIAALAFRNDAKWPIVRARIQQAALVIAGATSFFATGAFYGWLLPKQITHVYTAAFAVAASAICVVLLVEFAHWLRKP